MNPVADKKTAVPGAIYWWRKDTPPPCQARPLKPGEKCPACLVGMLAYDGLFVLTCATCGQAAESGAFT